MLNGKAVIYFLGGNLNFKDTSPWFLSFISNHLVMRFDYFRMCKNKNYEKEKREIDEKQTPVLLYLYKKINLYLRVRSYKEST